MATWRVNNTTLLGGEVCAQWQASHAYSLGARCVIRTGTWQGSHPNGRMYVYECTTAGASAGSEPTWPTTVGSTVVDNEVTWTCRSPSDGTWNNATPYLIYAMTAAAAGDSVYVHYQHSENITSTYYGGYLFRGSSNHASPVNIFSVDKDSSDALTVGAIVGDNYNTMYFQGCFYSYGVKYRAGYGGGTGNTVYFETGNSRQTCIVLEMDDPSHNIFEIHGSPNSFITFGQAYGYMCEVHIRNAGMLFNVSSAYFTFLGASTCTWENGVLDAPNGVKTLLSFQSSEGRAVFKDIDFGDIYQAGMTAVPQLITTQYTSYRGGAIFSRCKFPSEANMTYDIVPDAMLIDSQGQPALGFPVAELNHCSSGNDTLGYYKIMRNGKVALIQNNIYLSGGASVGGIPVSVCLQSGKRVLPGQFNNIQTFPFTKWNDGSTEITCTVEGIYDRAGGSDIDTGKAWVDIEYPADAVSGLGAIATTKIPIIGTPASLTTSAASWANGSNMQPCVKASFVRNVAGSSGYFGGTQTRTVIPASTLNQSGTRVRVLLAIPSWGFSTNNTIKAASIVPRSGSTPDGTTDPTQITFNGATYINFNGAVCINFYWSDWVAFTFDHTVDHLFCVHTDAGASYIYYTGVGYYKTTTTNETLIMDVSGYNETTSAYWLAGLQVAGAYDPVAFKFSKTFTPGKAGPITGRVTLSRPDSVIYINPTITVA